MHFFSAILVLTVNLFVGPTVAVKPGNNALHSGFSDEFETTLYLKYGPAQFNDLASAACNPLGCFGIITSLPCIVGCGLSPICILQCVGSAGPQLCGCLGCIPVVGDLIAELGICPATLLSREKVQAHFKAGDDAADLAEKLATPGAAGKLKTGAPA